MADLALLFLQFLVVIATFCRAQVSIEVNQLSVCQGNDVRLATCTTNGTGGLVWHFPGHPDVRYEPSTISTPNFNLTQERMNDGSAGVFVFTLESHNNQTDVYTSNVSVRNIQLTDNGTSLTCAESILQTPKSIVVKVKNCSSNATLSSTIATISSTVVVVPDRSTVTQPLSSGIITSSSTPTPAGPIASPVNAVVIAVPIVLILLLLIVIVSVMIFVLLIVRNKGRSKNVTIEMDNNYNDSPNLHNVALDGDDEMEKGTAPVHSAVNPGLTSSSSQSPIYDEVDDTKSEDDVWLDAEDNTAAAELKEEEMGYGEALETLEYDL